MRWLIRATVWDTYYPTITQQPVCHTSQWKTQFYLFIFVRIHMLGSHIISNINYLDNLEKYYHPTHTPNSQSPHVFTTPAWCFFYIFLLFSMRCYSLWSKGCYVCVCREWCRTWRSWWCHRVTSHSVQTLTEVSAVIPLLLILNNPQT